MINVGIILLSPPKYLEANQLYTDLLNIIQLVERAGENLCHLNIFLLTSAFGHPHPPILSANISIWPPQPTYLFADVILKSLTYQRAKFVQFVPAPAFKCD